MADNTPAKTTAAKSAPPKHGEFAGHDKTDTHKPADKPEPNMEKSHGKQTVGTGEGQISPTAADRDPSVLEGVDVDTSEAERIASGDKVAVYNVHAGITRRVGGPFLDQKELEEAEIRRAVVEGREPDFANNAGSAGVPLVTAAQLAQAHHADSRALGVFIDDNEKNDNKGPVPAGFVDAVGNATEEALETQAAERKAYADYDETKVFSHDDPNVVFAPGYAKGNTSKGD